VGVGSLMTPEIFGKAAILLAEDENVDMVMAISAPDNPRSIASLVEAHKVIKKPLVITLFDIPGLVEPHFKALLNQHIPTYYEPKRAAYALAKLAEYSEFKSGKQSCLSKR
jgi:acyl-CoA synthetase (NDP forming)